MYLYYCSLNLINSMNQFVLDIRLVCINNYPDVYSVSLNCCRPQYIFNS